jgi:hypothetical protein
MTISRSGDFILMKKILLACILVSISIACLAAPTPTVVPVDTVVESQLTELAALNPTERPIPPGIPTIPPPAIGAPTQMATATELPSSTPFPFTLAPIPTVIRKKSSTLDPNSDNRSITYSITGEAEEVEVTYVNPDESVENTMITLPFEKTMVFKKGAPLSLFARIESEYGSITCKVSSTDKVYIQNSASGINQIAFCSDMKVE